MRHREEQNFPKCYLGSPAKNIYFAPNRLMMEMSKNKKQGGKFNGTF